MQPNKFIQQIEAVTLSLPDIRRMLGSFAGTTKVMLYDNLKSFATFEALFRGRTKAVILLMEIQNKGGVAPVGHFIALLKQGNQIEHFDSYGLRVDQELGITHEAPFLSVMARNSRMKMFEDTKRLQRFKDHVNTCGRWCVSRVRLQHMSYPEFVSFWSMFGNHPDELVSIGTMFL